MNTSSRVVYLYYYIFSCFDHFIKMFQLLLKIAVFICSFLKFTAACSPPGASRYVSVSLTCIIRILSQSCRNSCLSAAMPMSVWSWVLSTGEVGTLLCINELLPSSSRINSQASLLPEVIYCSLDSSTSLIFSLMTAWSSSNYDDDVLLKDLDIDNSYGNGLAISVESMGSMSYQVRLIFI